VKDKELALYVHLVINLTRGIYKGIEDYWEKGARMLGLTYSQLHVLWLLFFNDSSSLTQLSSWGLWHLTTVRDIVNRMEKRGLVRTAPEPEDSRITRVYITPEGESLRHRSEEIVMQLPEIQPLIGALGAEGRQRLVNCLAYFCTQFRGKEYVQFVQSAGQKILDSC